MAINWDKPVQTRDGRKVRVLCTDGPARNPVIGIIDGCSISMEWTAEGRWHKNCDILANLDLINVPEPEREIVRWANVYPDNLETCFYDTRHEADEAAAEYRIACVPVTIKYRPGDGL